MSDGDRLTRDVPLNPERKSTEEGGPKRPDVVKPDSGNELLRRLRNVDPDRAKKYRQRSGQ